MSEMLCAHIFLAITSCLKIILFDSDNNPAGCVITAAALQHSHTQKVGDFYMQKQEKPQLP
jgi:hypothetical protein